MSLDWQRVLGINWYDRDAESIIETYSASLAPHAEVIRKTYTCPTDKMAMVEVLTAEIVRTGAAGAAGTPATKWYFTPDKGNQTILVMAWLTTGENSAGDRNQKIHVGNIMMYPGDKLEGATGDGSTGGTVYHTLIMKITEFDAFPLEIPVPDVQQPEAVIDPRM